MSFFIITSGKGAIKLPGTGSCTILPKIFTTPLLEVVTLKYQGILAYTAIVLYANYF